MRCEEVTRELASPTGAVPREALSGHLDACPGCAEWARRAARLDRIWEATRPLDPSPERLDALWLDASAALDRRNPAEPAPGRLPFTARASARARRGWIIGAAVVGLAQAAALLLAAFLPGRPAAAPKQGGEVAGKSVPAKAPTLTAFREMESEVDQIPVFRIDEARFDRIDNAPTNNLIAESSPFQAFSDMESRATP